MTETWETRFGGLDEVSEEDQTTVGFFIQPLPIRLQRTTEHTA